MRALLPILLLASTAHAASRPTKIDVAEAGVSLVPPTTWSESTSTAFGIGKSFAATAKLPGQAAVTTGVRSWLAPAGSEGQPAFHAMWIVGKAPSDKAQLGALARQVIDQARERQRQLDPRNFTLVGWQEARDGEVAIGQLEFTQPDVELRTLARTLVFVTADAKLHEVRLECLMADGVWAKPGAPDGSARAACEAALASVVPLNGKKLLPLGELPGAGTIRVTAEEEAPTEMQLETPPLGSKPAESQLPAAPPPASGRSGLSWLFIVGAVLAIGLAFLVKRRAA
jgi:hypothetical protein